MTFQIQKQISLFVNKIFYETIDINILNQLIDSDLLLQEKSDKGDVYENEKAQLIAYRKNYGKKGVKVKYNITQSGFGRVNPVKSLSLCSLRKEIRHTLAKNEYVDLDIVNCHPVILHQLCIKNKINFAKSLKRYVEDRDSILSLVMNKYNVSKDDAKNLFIRLMYFGKFENWADELILKSKEPLNFITNFKTELENISNIIVGSNQEIVDEIKKVKRKDLTNLRGSIVSYYLQEWERRILEVIYIYLRETKNIISNNNIVLCYDGVMIPKKSFHDELIKELEEEVFNKLNLRINIVQKEMNLDLIHKLNQEKERKTIEKMERINEMLEDVNYKTFDTVYFNNLQKYEEKKTYFENFVCKILCPDPCYIFTQEETVEKNQSSKQTYIWSKNNLIVAFQQYKIEDDNSIEQVPFIQRWINDENLKIYNRMDFLPINKIQSDERIKNISLNESVFNLFHGYNRLIKSDYDKSKREDILKIFKMLGKEICGGNVIYFDYFMKFIAQMIQFPNIRIPIAFIIKGKQGTGKNVFLQAICNLLDKRNYITSSNPKDFFGEYAEGFQNKLLVNINECEGKDTFDFEGRLKSFITEDTITLNAKFMRPITIQNYARLIIFSNKSTPIPIDVRSGDRRYVVFKTTETFLDKKKYNDSFWVKMVQHFKKPEFLSALYEELNEMNIKDYAFIKNRPITEDYLEMCKQFVPPMALFFEYYVDSLQFQRKFTVGITIDGIKENSSYYQKEIVEIGTELYQMFNEWSKKMGLTKEYETSIKKFYSMISELDLPIVKYKSYGIGSLKLTPACLYKFLINKKWIMFNENIIEEDISNTENEQNYDEFFDMI
jgi:hypothetical protein